mmetsp:Transcript_94190/g.151988  ORF Transcript_94190/g.151988 Transcript_94190/m.151988 type:complete len:170 (+) Transcript_94190:28-537(+)
MAHKSNPWKKSTAKVSFARHPAWRQPLARVLPRNVAEERQAEIETAPTEQQSRCQMPRRSQKDAGGAYVVLSCEVVGRKRWRIVGECSDSACTARCRTEPPPFTRRICNMDKRVSGGTSGKIARWSMWRSGCLAGYTDSSQRAQQPRGWSFFVGATHVHVVICVGVGRG